MSKRFTYIAVCMLVALVAVLPLAACSFGASDPKAAAQIESDICDELDDLKAAKGSAINIVKTKLTDMVGQQLSDMGVSSDELLDAYLDNFDYKVNDVSVTGDSALADITLTCRSVTDIVKSFLLKSALGDGSDNAQILMDCVNDAQASDVSVTLSLTKSDDGTYNVEEALTEAISKKLL